MAQADNVLFLYRNLLDSAVLTPSSALTPVDRVKDLRPTRFWRADTSDVAVINADHGVPVSATHGAAVAYNLAPGGTIRFLRGNDPTWATSLVDVTVEAWRPVAGLGFDGLGNSLGGYPILTGENDYRPYAFAAFGSRAAARYSRIELRNPPGATSKIELGRAFIGVGYQPSLNFGYGWEGGWVDPSELVDTESSVFVVRRRAYRKLVLTLENVPENEALSAVDDLLRIVGRSKDLMVVLFPTGSAVKQYRTTIYGVPLETSPLRNPYFGRYSVQIAVRELAR